MHLRYPPLGADSQGGNTAVVRIILATSLLGMEAKKGLFANSTVSCYWLPSVA